MNTAAKTSLFSAATIAEFALAIGAFAIGTGEFAAMGFLPDVANGWQVTVPAAGRIISAYALGVVVGAPLIAVVGARLSRRVLLLILMGIFALGNLASALAPSFVSLVVLRFVSALPHGAYFGVAALVAAGMAGPDGRARAVGRVMLGLTIATLVGTPVATWAGQALGWRVAFAIVGVLGLMTVAMVSVCVPRDRPMPGASPLRELGALREVQVWLTLAIGATGFGGMFAVFSYITPTLVNVSHIPESAVPFVLSVFGAGMIAGNIVGPKLADRALLPTIGGLMAWNVLVLVLFTVAVRQPVMAVIVVFFIGTGFAVVPTLQTRLMDVGKDAQTLAAALNHSAFNMANALGAWLGGVSIAAGYGWASTGWVGAALGLVGAAVFVVSLLLDRKTRASKTQPEHSAG
ncbi:MFS transporter [Pleomorphomonas sp. JP5]|uniref:MFS transporter n=1 Tax=Pleomorphomonas sp. JP5 TaxID=2942998 RepID=UPI0020448AA8|nr:MFS transporter [Pleomorphomonas sp. JP5]MCM5560173.1 MFS transporter [Pleomorphomonas sp. JP5]